VTGQGSLYLFSVSTKDKDSSVDICFGEILSPKPPPIDRSFLKKISTN
jgi:hypothetical protein